MSERINFLKRYPLIPSTFFILFAWFCLHRITLYKENLNQYDDSNNLIINELLIKANKPDWELSLTSRGLVFQTTKFGKVEFAYPQQVILKNDHTGSVKVYQSHNTQDEIEVTHIRQLRMGQERVIIKFRNKYYYFESSDQISTP